jgi:hypothetical protein
MYVILMSFGAGTAIPGGLFVPSILVTGPLECAHGKWPGSHPLLHCGLRMRLIPVPSGSGRWGSSRAAPSHPTLLRSPRSYQVGAVSGGLLGAWLRMWLPHWNIQPGLYSLMAATATLGGVFRWGGLGGLGLALIVRGGL